MKIGIFQFTPVFGEKQKNLQRMAEAASKIDVDLLVFPELCTTGYQFVTQDEVDAASEPIPEGKTVQALEEICRQRNCHIIAGISEKSDGYCFNSAVFVGPKSFIGVYRKTHLFWDEKLYFQPGDTGFKVWDIGSAKIGIMICYDWVYPEAARALARQGADIIVCPTNLVLPYCQDAMVTRSIENRVFTITANRIGTEERGDKSPLTFTGGSQVVNPRGEILFRLGRDNEALQTIEIDPVMARNKQMTPGNNLWEDLRPDQYFQETS